MDERDDYDESGSPGRHRGSPLLQLVVVALLLLLLGYLVVPLAVDAVGALFGGQK
jgi:hypothetical protein